MESPFYCPLAQLTSEVIGKISMYCQASQISRLLCSGSLILYSKLTSSACVREIALPPLASQCPTIFSTLAQFGGLKRLSIVGANTSGLMPWFCQQTLSQLPSHMEWIEFDFADASECWNREFPILGSQPFVDFDFPTHFPVLRTFIIKCEISLSPVLGLNDGAKLPPTLTHLGLLDVVDLGDLAIQNLPPGIEVFHMPMLGSITVEGLLLLSRLPLRSLHLMEIPSLGDTLITWPSTLKDFSIAFCKQVNPVLPPFPSKLRIGITQSLPDLHSFVLASHLIELKISALPFESKMVEALPRTLTKLHVSDLIGRTETFSCRLLPRQLGYLRWLAPYSAFEEPDAMPEALSFLGVASIDPDAITRLPASVTRIFVRQSEDHLLDMLPKSIIQLDIDLNEPLFQFPPQFRNNDPTAIHPRWTTAYRAVEIGDLAVLDWLQSVAGDLNHSLQNGASALHVAILTRRLPVIQYFIEKDAVWDRYTDEYEPLWTAIIDTNNIHLLDYFYRKPALRYLLTTEKFATKVIDYPRPEMIEWMLTRGIQSHFTQYTLLRLFKKMNSFDFPKMAFMWIKFFNADINEPNDSGETLFSALFQISDSLSLIQDLHPHMGSHSITDDLYNQLGLLILQSTPNDALDKLKWLESLNFNFLGPVHGKDFQNLAKSHSRGLIVLWWHSWILKREAKEQNQTIN